ncbi:MAG: LCP family protein [Anaerolineales bacterium]|nr:LCP family protein [Anaerolineales bacterium]MBP6211324.1 LCP family protein [Anaerolineales bacterium]
MTRSQKKIVAILTLIAAVLVIGAGYFAFQKYQAFAQQPLGPRLPASQVQLPPTWTPTVGAPAGSVTLVPTFAIPPTSTPQPLCGGPYIMNIVAIGADSRADNYDYGLSDAIRLVRVDFVTPKVSVLEFPRDLWVKIPHIADNLEGVDEGKLNQAYLFGQPGDGFHYWDDPSGGPGLLSLTLNLNFGVQADHYTAVNMRTFEKIIDAVGGIDIYVKDKDMSRATGLPQGENHLEGADALRVARNRKDGGFERANNQNLVLCALRKKVTSPAVVTQIPQLIESFRDNILTDFTPAQLGQLACLGTRLPTENIVFASFPEELFTPTRHKPDPYGQNPNGTFIWDADFEVLSDYVARFQAGTWPEPKLNIPDPNEETDEVICE